MEHLKILIYMTYKSYLTYFQQQHLYFEWIYHDILMKNIFHDLIQLMKIKLEIHQMMKIFHHLLYQNHLQQP